MTENVKIYLSRKLLSKLIIAHILIIADCLNPGLFNLFKLSFIIIRTARSLDASLCHNKTMFGFPLRPLFAHAGASIENLLTPA